MVLIMLFRPEGLWPSPKHGQDAKLAKRAGKKPVRALSHAAAEITMSDKPIRLSVKGVNKRFGGLQALAEVGLESGKAKSTA